MSRIIPGRRYTQAEIQALKDDPSLVEAGLKGYVLRANEDGTLQFIHWSKAAEAWDDKPRMGHGVGLDAFGELPSIVKRTPQERVDSLMLKLIEDCRRTGTVPGISDERISAILGYTKNTSRAGITAEEIRRIAQHFLEKAQRESKANRAPEVALDKPRTVGAGQ